jgi:hypothetical protein
MCTNLIFPLNDVKYIGAHTKQDLRLRCDVRYWLPTVTNHDSLQSGFDSKTKFWSIVSADTLLGSQVNN